MHYVIPYMFSCLSPLGTYPDKDKEGVQDGHLFKRFSCILLKCIMHAANNQLSDKNNNVAAGYCRMCSTYIYHSFSSVNI